MSQTNVPGVSSSQSSAGQHSQPRPGQFALPPAPQISQNTGLPTSTGSSVPAQSVRHRTIFRFRSERANWIAVAAIVITVILGVVAAFYSVRGVQLAEDSKQIAVWEAEKDYQIYCQSLKAAHLYLPADCSDVVDAVLRPPPFHDPSLFVRILATIKRGIALLPPAGALKSYRSPSIWLSGFCFVLLGYESLIVSNPPTPPLGQSTTCLANILLLATHVFFTLLNNIDQSEAASDDTSGRVPIVLVLLWVAVHLWTLIYIVKTYNAQGLWHRVHRSACACSSSRALIGLAVACNQSLGRSMLAIVDSLSTALFIWPTREHRGSDKPCPLEGGWCQVQLWYLAYSTNAALGMLFSVDLVIGHNSIWDIEDQAGQTEKFLQLCSRYGRNFLAMCIPLWIVALFIDGLLHEIRHRRHRTQCSTYRS